MTNDNKLIVDVRAELVGAASIFAHEDKEVNELACVYIFPGFKGGAVVYALNGHAAFLAEDETATIEHSARLSFNSDLIKACGHKVDCESRSRVQISEGSDYVRVLTQGKSGEFWTDFAPSYFALNPSHYPSYGGFVKKFSEAHCGISAQIINGNTMAKMQKLFKQKEKFLPVLHQNPKDTKAPIFITFDAAPCVLIVNMPMEGIDEGTGGEPYYTNLSDIAQSLCAAPCATGIA